MMAARNRPRAGLVKDESADAHEERNMWNQIVTDIKKLKQINAKAAEISTQIVEMEAVMARVDPETGNGRSAVISSSSVLFIYLILRARVVHGRASLLVILLLQTP